MKPILILFYFIFLNQEHLQAQLRIVQNHTKASFRALSVVNDSVAWLAGSQGTIGRSHSGGRDWQFSRISGFEDSDFRSLFAFDSLKAIVANAGSPAVILLTQDGGRNWNEVYRNSHKEAFLDGVDFWDYERGMVYGDPIKGSLLLVKTSDGGRSWTELPEQSLPQSDSGEASFAASGTNIRLWDQHKMAIATGGLKSRIWFSENESKTWKSISVPILQGTDSRGIFSLFIRDKNWIVAGGDYKSDTLKQNHIFTSSDGGNTWVFPQEPTGGYRECIAEINEQSYLAVGPSGVDFTRDGGKNWSPISAQTGFHVVRKARNGKLVLLAGAKGLIGIFE